MLPHSRPRRCPLGFVPGKRVDLDKLSDTELLALRDKLVSEPNFFEQFDPAPEPWTKFGMVAAIAFGIPLVALILGASLVSAFSGFRCCTLLGHAHCCATEMRSAW